MYVWTSSRLESCCGRDQDLPRRAHLEDPPHAVDEFYTHVGDELPKEGEIINVVRFLRSRVIRARVTRVDIWSEPQIDASQLE